MGSEMCIRDSFKCDRRDFTHSLILRNKNNVYLNGTEWRVGSGGTKFLNPIEEMSKEELNACLTCFDTSARKKDSTYYKSLLIKSIRADINRSLHSSPHKKRMKKPLSEVEN